MTEARPVHHDSDSHLANDDDQHYELEMNHEATHSVTEPKLLKKAKKGSLFGALFSRTLPQYGGGYHVGVRDVEVDVPHQSFGNFRHKLVPDHPAGVELETCLFSLFYPAEPPAENKGRKRVIWFPRLGQTIDGFLRMARRAPNWFYRTCAYPLAAAAIWGTTFPADKNAPLLDPQESQGNEATKRWPVIFFSHGVGCSRLMYSAFCGEMASRGYVVVALEHRDGTGPSTQIELDDGRVKDLSWLDWRDIHWPDLAEQPKDDTTLRKVQLQLRQAELQHATVQMQMISQGNGVARKSPDDFDWTRWRHAIDTAKPIMSGHSFGGTLALAAAASRRFSFSSIIAFDPAVQRLEPWNSSIREPLLVINSEEFVNGPEYGKLTNLSKTASASTIFSIAGSTHPSFSDVHLILPAFINRRTGLKAHAETVFDVAIPAVEAFLDGNFAELRKMAAHNISELPAASPLTDVHNSSHLQVPSPLGPGPSLSQRPSAYSIRPSNRSRTSSLSTTTSMRPEPGAFLFHSSTHVNLHDMVEEESSRVPATSKA